MRQRPDTLSERSDSPVANSPDARLRGSRLLLARVGYLAMSALVVALNLVALPDIYVTQVTPDMLPQLQRQGFSPTLYAVIATAGGVAILLLCIALSLLIFWRRSDDRMALLCAFMLVTVGGVAASPLDDVTGSGPLPKPLSAIPALAATDHLLIVVGQVALVAFFCLFPSGRFVPRWTRWLVTLALVYWFIEVFFPQSWLGQRGNLILVFWLAAAVAQIYRYRRVSAPVEREQTKWVVFGFAFAVLIVVVPALLQILLPDVANSVYHSGSVVAALVISNTWVVAALMIPIVIAIAVLRTHLWDIDVIINRALVYGLLTVLLAALYVLLTIGMESLTSAVTGKVSQQPAIIVVATLLIAALFNPLRGRIQAGIDQRFYRRKYDAARTLEAFSVTLRSETDLSDLNARLIAVVAETMQPAGVWLWLRSPAASRVATPGSASADSNVAEAGP